MRNDVIHYPNEMIKYGFVEAVVDALEKNFWYRDYLV